MALKSKLKVLIISAAQTFYDGDAYAVTSENDVGPFDVLEQHAVFISLIKNRVLVYKTPEEKVEFPVTKGVLTVKDDTVRVYIGF